MSKTHKIALNPNKKRRAWFAQQYTEDRDVNAAKNLKQLAAGYAKSINACGV